MLNKTAPQDASRLQGARAALLALPLFLYLLCSCAQKVISTETIDFYITSPKPGWMYYENTKMILAVNINTDNIIWSSDTAGFLGKGNHLAMFLPQGLHRIKADVDGYTRELAVYVSPGTAVTQTILVNYTPMEIKMKNGNNFSFLYTHNGAVNDFKLSPIPSMQTSPASHTLGGTASLSMSLNTPNRDIRLPMPAAGKPVEQLSQRKLFRSGYTIGSKRHFYVINTGNQTGTPHSINAE